MNKRKAYPTDLSDKQWEQLVQLLPLKQTEPERMLEYINAILYVLHTGCSWRMLPHDFPSWSTVYDVFQKLNRTGTWLRVNDELREQVRQVEGRETEASVLIADSQSVKTTEKGAHAAMMAVSKSKDANAISSSIPKDG
jgi:putative transposase